MHPSFKLIAMFVAGLAAGCSNAPMSPVADAGTDAGTQGTPAASNAAPMGAWHWLGTQAGAALWVVDEPGRYRLEFAGDSQLQLQVDCNRGSASYTISADGVFQAGPAGLTKMGCGDASHDRDFVAQLAQAGRLSVDGDWLQLALGDGGVMLYARDAALRLHGYQCAEGGAFAAALGGTSAAVLVDGGLHVLRPVASAAGTHYRNGSIELRADADQATLSGIGRDRRGCRVGD